MCVLCGRHVKDVRVRNEAKHERNQVRVKTRQAGVTAAWPGTIPEHRAVESTATARPMGSRTRQSHQSEQQAIGQEHADDVDVVDGLRRGCSATRSFVKGNHALRPKQKPQAAANTSERERKGFRHSRPETGATPIPRPKCMGYTVLRTAPSLEQESADLQLLVWSVEQESNTSNCLNRAGVNCHPATHLRRSRKSPKVI